MSSKQRPANKNTTAFIKDNKSGVASEPLHSAASVDCSHRPAEPKRASEDQPAPALRAAARQPSLADAREGWMEKIKSRNAVRTISANELTSLSALIAYAAYKTGASEFRIERNLADRFNIPNVKCLPAICFDDAMRYLVDQVPAQTA